MARAPATPPARPSGARARKPAPLLQRLQQWARGGAAHRAVDPDRTATVEEVEPRILYAADLNPALWAAEGLQATALVAPLQAQAPEVHTTTPTAHTPRREIVFIDAAVPDAERLLDGLLQARGAAAEIEVVHIAPDGDALAFISDVLAQEQAQGQPLDAVHIVSHGAAGQLLLGGQLVDHHSLARQAPLLQGWAAALNAEADLLLWGCDVGQGTAGQAFTQELARLTGADVAASTDTTGGSARQGNWALESSTGPVADSALQPTTALADFNGSLAVYTVSNLNNSGAGSLRQAIIDANANGGADSIAFSVFGTISLSTALPAITGPVSINGTNGGVPGIVLNGGGTIGTGLQFDSGASNSTLRGLVVQNFSSYGIRVIGASGVTIAGNYVGTNAAGTAAAGNNVGIDLYDAPNATIGGTVAADRNLVSGNTNIGINIVGSGAGNSGTVVRGNTIGINAVGSGMLGNTFHGIYIDSSTGVTIGGSASGAGNLIGNNGTAGVTLGASASGNTIAGNTIGLNLAGSGTMANGSAGVWILGANNTVGGTTAAERNVVSGNTQLGVRISGASATGNTVLGNYIGTGPGGITDMGNGEDGIQIDTGASNNTIGGTAAGAGNIIAGNNNAGIALDNAASTGNQVLGNWIGVGSNGTTLLANSLHGISINGATATVIGNGTAAGRNIITANTQRGISVIGGAVGTNIQGNWVTYNGFSGITMEDAATTGTVIGGDTAASANLIAYNTWDGILVSSTASASNAVTILANNIYGNGERGIDLGNDGYTNNDSGDVDTGPNGLQNFPVLTSASTTATGTSINGSLNSTANTNYRVDFYTNRPANVDGSNGEGERWLGYAVVAIDGTGTVNFGRLLSGVWINQGDRITATATRMSGVTYLGTSEFAANITGTSTNVVVVDTTSDTADGTTSSITNLGNARGGDGRISLREAMAAANNTTNGASADRIVFAIPPNIESGNLNMALARPTIAVASNMTAQTQAVNIDATTQPGYAGTPVVRLDASGAVTHGLQLNAGSAGSTVRGLSITGFTTAGIAVSSSNTNTIASNYIGLAPDGVTVDANQRGIQITTSTGTTVGGLTAGDGNVISGNNNGNLYLMGAVNSLVYGNLIGTDATGTLDADGVNSAIGRSGVYLDGASTGNQIGDTAAGAGNLISGNDWVGVDIISATATNNTIAGNLIGVGISGLSALGNDVGISFFGSGSGNRAVGNVVSGNVTYGVQAFLSSNGAIIQGNYIGLGIDGSTIVGSQLVGVAIYNGATNTVIGTNADGSNDAAETNVISGNNSGIIIADTGTTGTLVQGNLIGTDASGLLARGNTVSGIEVFGGTGTTIGGTSAARRNIISGNGLNGITLATPGVTVLGNYVGLNATGTGALANSGNGIAVGGAATGTTIGGAAAGAGNVISGNGNPGVGFDSGSSGTVLGNRIGTNAAGTATIAGGGAGVFLATSGVQVGGTATGEGNTIAGASGAGIVVSGAVTGNALLGNSIYGNAGLAIDLGDNGVTANDAAPDSDTGANNLQNFPVLTTARAFGNTQLILTGSLAGAANSFYRVEFFSNTSQDSSGYGEAQTYLGFVNVPTNGSGAGTISVTLGANVSVGSFISATATSSNAAYNAFTDTSEMARNVAAVNFAQAVVTVDTTSDTSDGDTTSISTLLADKGADGFISLREAITAANNTANGTSPDLINFAISGTGVHTITPLSALPQITQAVVIDATTEDSVAANGGRPAVEIFGNALNAHGLSLSAAADGTAIRGLSISGFGQWGIVVASGSNGNTLQGNYIGLRADGTTAGGNSIGGIQLSGSSNLIGGSTAAERNVISGNTGVGLIVMGSSNTITGNYVGTDATGALDRGNGGVGITLDAGASATVIGGTLAGERNIISGNNSDGILITNNATGTLVRGNYIGTAVDGVTAVGNSGAGVRANGSGASNTIGGTSAGQGNLIAHQGNLGISVSGTAAGVSILGNSLVQNTGLGIDLGANGVTANDTGDADTGANNLQNYPVLVSAYSTGGNTTINGTLNSNASTTYRIEFFSSPTGDATGNGEGQVVLGATTVTTDGSGNASFATVLTGVTVTPGHRVSATTTVDLGGGNFGSTSEFAANLTATHTAPAITVGAISGNTTEAGGTATFTVVLDTAPTANVTIAVSSSNTFEGTVSTGLLTFTSANWNVAQTVTVSGVNETLVDGNRAYTVVLGAASSADPAYNGLNPADLALTNTDNDTQNTITVTTTSDTADGDTSSLYALLTNPGADGFISLREAMTAANNTANGTGPDLINFAISGTGVHTITPLSALPQMTQAVAIDATGEDSVAANGGRPAVEIFGNGLNEVGLTIAAGGGGSSIKGLSIGGFLQGGAVVSSGANGTTLQGNYFGLRADGVTTGGNGGSGGLQISSNSNLIGGTTAAERNVISGNTSQGLRVLGSGNTVIGNYVGTDASGLLARGNAGVGLSLNFAAATNNVVGGTAAGERNVIAGNNNTGVSLSTAGAGNVVRGNFIGVAADGVSPLANTGVGLRVDNSSAGQTIGGAGAGQGNVIAHSPTNAGVVVGGTSTGVVVLGNTVFNNGALGLDLGGDGVTANDAGDADTGPNNLQNFPVLAGAITNGSSITVNGRLNSAANSFYRIEFFANTSGDASGNGQGQTLLGFANVATDAAGNAAYAATFTAAVPTGQAISATATRATDGSYSSYTDTSEFAANVLAHDPVAPTQTVPGAQTTAEDTARVFSTANSNALTIADSDAGGANNQVTLSVSNGTLTLAGTVGLSFVNGDGTADTTMTLRGTAAAINTALNGLSFAPNANYNGGAVLTIATTDAVLLSLDIDTGLVGRYAFENPGNLGLDNSPAGANPASTMNSPAAVLDGSRGNVIELNGNNGLQAAGVMGSPANVTLAAWVNLTAADAFGAEVISLGDRISLRLDQAGQMYAQHYNGSTFEGLAFSATLAGTGWRHVAFSFDDTNNTRTLYLDGVAVASQSTSDSVNYAGATSTVIGRNGAGGTSHDFTGRIDEARIYNRALTPQEIAALADDTALVDSDTVALTVTAVNDAPLNTLPGTQITPVNTALVLGGVRAISVTDVDAATLQVSLSVSNGSLTLAGTAGLAFSMGDGTADAAMVFTGTAAAINTALDGLSYTPTGGFQGSAVLSLTTSDGGSSGSGGPQSDSDTLEILVGAQQFQQGLAGYAGTDDTYVSGGTPSTDHGNASPVLVDDNNAGDAILLRFGSLFGSGGGQIPAGSTITSASLSFFVTHPDANDSVSLHSMLGTWNEASTYNSLGTGVQANGSEAAVAALATLDAGVSGWVTVNGLASLVQGWANGGTNNGFAFLTTNADGWAFASSEHGTAALRPYLSINYTPPQPAVVTASGGNAVFTENGTAVAVDPGLVLSDADSSQLTGASVAITTGFVTGQDTLAFSNQAGITGSWNAGTGTLTLSGTASVAQYQAALRSITFSNNSEAPAATARTVVFSVQDAWVAGGSASRNVDVVAVNDAPVLSAATLTLNEGQTVTLSGANFTVSDVDSGSFSYAVSGLAGGHFQLSSAPGTPVTVFSSADLAGGLVQFVDDGNEVAPAFSITVSDGALNSSTLAATVNCTPVNDAPVVNAASLTLNEGETVTLSAANFTVTDPDSGSFTYTVSGLTGGYFQLSTAAGTPVTTFTTADLVGGLVQFVDDANEVAPAFSITVNDGALNSNTLVATINYTPVNDAPVVNAASLTLNEGETVTLSPANFTVTDPDNGSFTYTVSSLAGGYFQLSTAVGTPVTTFTTADLVGGLVQFVDDGNEVGPAFSITANDGALNSNTLAASIIYTPVNDAPVLNAASLTLNEGETVTLSAANFTVTDPDSASFTYTVSSLAGGYFQLSTAAGTPVTTFTTAHLVGGLVQFVDDANEVAPTFSITTNDGALNSNTLAASIIYTPVNDAPVVNAASLTLNEGETVTLSAANFTVTDPDNASFTYTVSGLAGGYFQLTTAAGTPVTTFTTADLVGGLVQFVDDANEVAPTFSITANDGALNSNTLSATINYTPVNDAPVVNAASLTLNEGETVTLSAANFTVTDPDNASFTYTVSGLAGGYFQLSTAAGTPVTTFTTADLVGGLVQFVDDANEVAPAFSITASDGALNSNTLAASIIYTPVNDTPVVNAASLTLNEGETVTLSHANFTVTDPDSGSFTYTVSGLAGGYFQLSSAAGTPVTTFTTANLVGGLVQFVDDANEVAPAFSITVNDGALNSNTLAATINYTPVNDAPVVNAASLTLNEGETVTLSPANFTVTDPDNASFTYTVSSLAGGYFQLSSAAGTPVTTFTTANLVGGLVQFVDDANEVAPAFSITVNDGALNSNTLAATISYTPVNDAPVVNAASLTLNEGETVTLSVTNFTVTDPDNASFTYTVSGLSGGYFQLSTAAGTPVTTFTTADLVGGLVQFVDDANEVAPTFSITANDGALNSNTLAATINYTPVNDAPVLNAASLTLNEGGTVTLSAGNFTVTDPDNASFTYTVSSLAGGYFQLTSAAGTPVTTFTTADLAAGLVQFVDDGNEVPPAFNVTASDGALSSNTLAATINYTPVNDAPVVGAASLTLNEGETVTLNGANFAVTDPDNASYTYTVSGLTGGYFQLSTAAGTPVTIFTTADLVGGLVQYVDDANEVAPAFSITVSDGALNSNTLAATINYTPVKDAPVMGAASLTLNEGETVTLSAGNFTVTDPDNASFTHTISGLTGGYFQLTSAVGTPVTTFTTADLAGGLVQFVDDGNEVAPAFSVTVSDGALNSNTLPATINYTPVNDAPVVNAASLTLNEGETVTLSPANFTVTDPDSASFTYTVSGLAGGYFQLSSAAGTPVTTFTTANLVGGLVQFVDDANEVAPAFSITANEGALNSNTLAATINYTPVNDAPVVNAASLTLNEGETVTLSASNFTVTDPDNSSFTYTVSGLSGGYFQLTTAMGTPVTTFTTADLAGGLVQFVDDGNEVAPTYSVTANDGALNSNTLAATINYTPVNDAPVVGAASLTLNEGETVTLSGANFTVTDPDNTSFTYSVSGLTGGFFQLTNAAGTPVTTFTTADLAGGLVQFVDDGNEAAPAYSVTVNDGALNSNTLAATVNYTPVNDAPLIMLLDGDVLNYTEGDGALPLDALADSSVQDPDSPNLDGGSLVVRFTGGLQADQDVIMLLHQGQGAGQVGVAGSQLLFGGTPIGSVSGGANGEPLVVGFNAQATPAAATALLRRIGYENTNTAAPVAGLRSLQLQFSDGDGGSAPLQRLAVQVAALDDAPLGLPVTMGLPSENQVLQADVSAVSDPDGLGPLSFQWLRDNTVIAGATGSSYQLRPDDVGSSVRVRVSWVDGLGRAESLTSGTLGRVARALSAEQATDAASSAANAPPAVAGMPDRLDAENTALAAAPGSGADDGSRNPVPASVAVLLEAPSAPAADPTSPTDLRALRSASFAQEMKDLQIWLARDRDAAAPPPGISFEWTSAAADTGTTTSGTTARETLRVQWRSSAMNHSGADGEGGAAGLPSAGEAEEESALVRIFQSPAPVASAGITAGVLWWLTRSGGLLTSILMGVPAWRHVDLLPVLSRPVDHTARPRPGDPDKDRDGDNSHRTDTEPEDDDFDDSAIAGMFDEAALEPAAREPA